MKPPILDITEGWTGRLGPFTLKNKGVVVNLDGFIIELILSGKNGVEILIPTSQLVIPPQIGDAVGTLYYDPLAADTMGKSKYSPFTLRWEVVDGSGKMVYFPNGEAEIVNIYKR